MISEERIKELAKRWWDDRLLGIEDFIKIVATEAREEGIEWIGVEEERMPRPHETVIAKCSNGDIYQARVCYGMHEPWWCGHSELNFGTILRDKGLVVTHWAKRPKEQECICVNNATSQHCPVHGVEE